MIGRASGHNRNATSNPLKGVLFIVLLVAALAATAELAAQQTITVDVDLVNIYFTVCNAKGRLVRNLTRESFTVLEDDNPQSITNFSRETNLPLTMALLIDTSGSVRYKLGFEQEAAINFLQSTLQPGRDKAAVFTFDSTLDLKQDYTDDLQVLANAIKHTVAGGGTSLYDSLHFLLEGPLAAQPGRRGVILLSDGDDNSSRTSPLDVVHAAQRGNVAIYAISVNSIDVGFGHSRRGDGILGMFGQETGGNAFFPKRIKDLSTNFAEISNELRSQYTIGYRSTNAQRDGAFRKIRIDADRGNYSVHSRSGYYAAESVASCPWQKGTKPATDMLSPLNSAAGFRLLKFCHGLLVSPIEGSRLLCSPVLLATSVLLDLSGFITH